MICYNNILYQIDIGCPMYKELDVKAIDIIKCVTQGEKEIYCVQPCLKKMCVSMG